MDTTRNLYERERAVRKGRKPKGASNLVVGTAIVLGLLGATGGFIAANSKKSENAWGDVGENYRVGAPIEERVFEAPRLVIEGVALGMTAEEVRKALPTMTLSPVASGEQVGTFRDGKRTIGIRFTSDVGGGKAFRLRLNEALPGLTDANALRMITKMYGKPVRSRCSESLTATASECRHEWGIRDGVSLEAVVRVAMDENGALSTHLSLLAVDTNMEGKQLRQTRHFRHNFPQG